MIAVMPAVWEAAETAVSAEGAGGGPVGFGWPARLRAALRLALVCLAFAVMAGSAAWAQGGDIASFAQVPVGPSPAVTASSSAVTPNGPSPTGWALVSHVVTMPGVTVLLLVAGCLLLFHDLLTPFTWGATGTIGVTLIGLVFAANVTEHTYGWIGVLLLLAGLALLLAEIHIVPGHGMAAIGGLLLMFLGMYSALGGARHLAFSLSVSSVLTVVALLAFFAYLPKSPVWKQIGREMQQKAALASGVGSAHASFLGRSGVAVTGLHPSGIAEIEGVRLDVVTEGEFLSPGAAVVVSRVDGNRVVVDSAAAFAAEQELREATLS